MGNLGDEVYSFGEYAVDLTRGCVRNATREIELRAKASSFSLTWWQCRPARFQRRIGQGNMAECGRQRQLACAMHQRSAAGPQRCRPAYHQDGAPARVSICRTGGYGGIGVLSLG